MARSTRCPRCREPALPGATHCVACNTPLGFGPFLSRRMWASILLVVGIWALVDLLLLLNERKLMHRREAETAQVAAELRDVLTGSEARGLRELRPTLERLQAAHPQLLPAERVERVVVHGGRPTNLLYDAEGKPVDSKRKHYRFFWKAALLRGGEWYEVTGSILKRDPQAAPIDMRLDDGPESIKPLGDILPPQRGE